MSPRPSVSIAHFFAFVTLTALSISTASAQIIIPTVPVGNPGNSGDTRVSSDGTSGYGSVAYTYNIGSTEVTNAQYAAFLNAVAADDSNGLYNAGMAGVFGGITRSGSAGAYSYATISGRADNPVNSVSFWSSTRFANWLHNGQPTGPQNSNTTEDGAYTLTPSGITNNTVARNSGWQWAVTSEDEWYKAAYYQPVSQGGPAGNYWLYPNSSNSITSAEANYNAAVGNTVPVGSYAANFYGVFDMGGNVYEWNEGIIDIGGRGQRGGYWNTGDALMLSTNRTNAALPDDAAPLAGFRVVAIPAPSSAGCCALARSR